MSELSIEELARLGALAYGDGYRTKMSEHGQPGYRILRVADLANGSIRVGGADFVRHEFTGKIGSKLSQPDDVLVTTKGTVGRVAIVPPEMEQVVYSPQLCYFRVVDRTILSPHYLSYWFRSPEFRRQALYRANSTDMAAYINLKDIASLKLDVPTVLEQCEVSNLLRALDEKIAVDEGLVRRAENLMVVLASRSGASMTVRELAEQRLRVSTPNFLAPSVALFSLPAFDSGAKPEIVTRESIKSNKFLLEGPAVLVSKLNPRIPRIWNVSTLPCQMAIASTEFVVLAPREVSASTLWAMLSQPSLSSNLVGKVAGTSGSHQRVNPSDILDVVVPNPSHLPDKIREAIDDLGELAASARRARGVLAATRDELLPLLLSGRLRVKDAEKVVEEVL